MTFQLKGPAAIRAVGGEDLARADRFMADARGALEELGVAPAIIAPWLTARGATVARLGVSEIYVQTPGPQAGMLVGMGAP